VSPFHEDHFKQQFPLFQQPENQRLVYLDNGATTQRPNVVLQAMNDFYLHANGNAHRSSHRLANAATQYVEQCRAKIALFINTSPNLCVFTSGATAAMNQAVFGVCEGLKAGDEVILSVVEHHANIVPWQQQAALKGFSIRYLPLKDGSIDTSLLAAWITPNTKVVCLSAASNVLGALLDVQKVRQILNGRNIAWGLDLTQYIAHKQVDITEIGCDFAVFSAHKMLGPTGIGVLWAKPECLDAWPPLLTGGEMIDEVTLLGSTFRDGYAKFETGTANLAAMAGFSAAIDFIAGQNRNALIAHEQDLVEYAHHCLQKNPNIMVVTRPENNVGVLSFVPSANTDLNIQDIANWLDESDIAVRAGVMCAQPLANALGIRALIRLSFAAYNSRADIDRCADALNQLFDPSMVEDDSAFDVLLSETSWQNRYRVIMQWGSELAPQVALRNERNIVKGCETTVWMDAKVEEGRASLKLDADSRVMRGLCKILINLIDGKPMSDCRREIIEQRLAELQLQKHLTASRTNGFFRILEAIDQSLQTRA
jgi:SufS family cysteine desulfurase